MENRGKEYCNKTYQTISRASIGVVYKVCLGRLASLVKKISYGVTKDKDEQLETWLAEGGKPVLNWRL